MLSAVQSCRSKSLEREEQAQPLGLHRSRSMGWIAGLGLTVGSPVFLAPDGLVAASYFKNHSLSCT
jgi:hypothetical protein